ncbi:type I phosphomannose isomerase catalytic subunit [Nonlabens antarcticus]|uniref:type I phosphomannose isomerase catalytic subunit n=1 Tax=Nonlabens antarcticus TaxID=392714 RepID=UPI001890EA36|nr:type I phosphomannose isomerase catalytic subunit [Nonlabens antarcticus]
MNWYPLTFQPIYKEKIWGGSKLNSLKKVHPFIPKLGESWEISDVGNDISIVDSGSFKGRSLKWLLENHGEEVMGKRIFEQFGTQFPLLIKYIDAAQDLSIQLHPDDAMARDKHNSSGKTEMWYVMDAVEGATLTLGFKENCKESAFAKAIHNNNLPALLNSQKVKEGDAFLIKPGFIHAIGSGIMLAEIQQSSDVTYRVYDYDRRDDKGKPRDLHIEQSIAAADYSKAENYKLAYNFQEQGVQELGRSDYFLADILQFEGQEPIDLHPRDSFTILMNVGDDCELEQDGMIYKFSNSQTYLIPSVLTNLSARCSGNGKLLVVHL